MNLTSAKNLFLVFVTVLFFSACREDSPLQKEYASPQFSGVGQFANVSVSMGMLQFPSEQEVIQVTEAIEDLEDQLEQFLHQQYPNGFPNMARYNAIYDPLGPFKATNPISGKALKTLSPIEQEKLDDDPIKYLFEEAFAYQSLRRYLVNEEYTLLAAGTFDGAGNDPDDHFIADDMLRMLLNKNLEWKVENKVIKIVSGTAILQIEDPTAAQLTTLQSEFAPPLTYTDFPDLPNPGICYANPNVTTSANVTVIDFMEPLTPQSCVAGFTRTIGTILPTQVTFTNTSLGSYSSLDWDFGDGNVSTTPSPTHTYAQNGTYTVTLSLYDGVNICDAYTDQIVISSNCTADFDAVVSNSNQTLVSFTDLSSSGSSTVSSWLWDFGDGNTSSQANPNHTYSASGTYNVCLTITTIDNCVEQYCDDVTVSSTCCKTNKTLVVKTPASQGGGPIPVGNNRGLKGKVWITTIYPFYRRVGSKTKCYRLKNNGNWTTERADYISTGTSGNVRNNDCSQLTALSQGDAKNNAKSVSEAYPFSYIVRLGQGDITGAFEFDDNGANNWTQNATFLTSSQCN